MYATIPPAMLEAPWFSRRTAAFRSDLAARGAAITRVVPSPPSTRAASTAAARRNAPAGVAGNPAVNLGANIARFAAGIKIPRG